ncbi:Os06g0265100 [Oryza sativa Japonica Group]|uniref:Os06g0265100 protein n=1 Tax=Oryza sativa subsp. japonica TaxID=39947 RepID=Q0DD18_ORYSJ|nr:Os06g0265100 [Oryza sativa Japonica Group]|eukprot:NP_001057341.2 Os06g0265100 [Oryza sativa Japonica Group]
MNPLHHTGNQQATQQGKAGPGNSVHAGNEVSFSILTHGIHLKFVRLYHRHHLASLKLKVKREARLKRPLGAIVAAMPRISNDCIHY